MNRIKIICVLVILVFGLLVLYHNAYTDVDNSLLKQADVQSLREGNIVIKKQKSKTQEGEIARVAGAILIQKPIQEVWKCILDWERMPQYVDTLDYYTVLAKINHNTSIIEGQIHVAFLKFNYTLLVSNDERNYYQKWQLISENDIVQYNIQKNIKPASTGIKNIEGYQYCIPLDDNNTIVYYAPVVEVSVPVPGFVENNLTQKSIKDYLYGIKRYLEGGYNEKK
ncbi:MAG: SRPBCC family protein [Spirochaetota bacterium]|nr:SRPBCC family protein [Spirochaetota bacterium]